MGQKSEPAGFDQVYVLGLDRNGKPRGARFGVLKDSIVSAAMDMNCRVLISQSDAVSALGMTLPIGHVFGTGKLVKLFIPNIGRKVYGRMLEAARIAAEEENTRIEEAISGVMSTLH
jgi:hypothetical protein